ncbi:hypothetical protein [Pseudomonas oryzihabitans]|uniref:hypothetical protein n=1 Tax=Pseudomonas oryzihabitans TaxID=47885 RepID=UPI002894BD8A|nr:hypothetical protein [Pseudomonas oryzihabitans]MDT3723173.1 hypothetical protein [Pseudomonas oryzihabitans]
MTRKNPTTPAFVVGLDIGYSNVKRVDGYADAAGGDIALAIGRYHTPNPALSSVARAYGEDVLRVWRRLILLSKSEGGA